MPEHPLASLGLDLLSFVWPAVCLDCGSVNRDWCSACRAKFLDSHEIIEVLPDDGGPARWLASGSYSGVRKELIARLKHGGQLGVAPHLGQALRGPLLALMRESSEPPLIVPIPSRAARVRARGYRHVDLVLRHTGIIGAPYRGRILAPTVGRTSQVGLGEGARRRNAERIRLRGEARVAGREVILVDDVVTTGATLGAAGRLLTHHGARVIGAATLAVALKLHDP